MKKSRFARYIPALWIIGVVCYSAIRSLIVAKSLSKYGVNPYLFFVIDVGTALPYGYGQVKTAIALRHGGFHTASKWLALVLVCFLAPYGYLFFAGAAMPLIVYVVVAIVMVLFASIAGFTLFRRVRHTD